MKPHFIYLFPAATKTEHAAGGEICTTLTKIISLGSPWFFITLYILKCIQQKCSLLFVIDATTLAVYKMCAMCVTKYLCVILCGHAMRPDNQLQHTKKWMHIISTSTPLPRGPTYSYLKLAIGDVCGDITWTCWRTVSKYKKHLLGRACVERYQYDAFYFRSLALNWNWLAVYIDWHFGRHLFVYVYKMQSNEQ